MSEEEQAGSMVTSVTDEDGQRAAALVEAMHTGDRVRFDVLFDLAIDNEDRTPYDSMKGLVEALVASGLTHFLATVDLRAEVALLQLKVQEGR